MSFYSVQQSEDEISTCKQLLSGEEHYRTKRYNDAIDKYVNKNEGVPDKPLNTRQLTSGITYAPLLIGKVPISLIKMLHLPLLVKELEI